MASLARKRMASGALFRDETGGVLLVNPVYKPPWHRPGGAVEAGEGGVLSAACLEAVESGRVAILENGSPPDAGTRFAARYVVTLWQAVMGVGADKVQRRQLRRGRQLAGEVAEAILTGSLDGLTLDPREVLEARLFSLTNLPAAMPEPHRELAQALADSAG